MSGRTSVNVIGAGRVGASLARALQGSGQVEIVSVMNASAESTEDAVRFIGGGLAAKSANELRPAEVWLLGAQDRHQPTILEALSGAAALRSSDVVISLSGFLSSEDLRSAASAQRLGTFHPMQTFPERVSEEGFFSGMPFAVEGDADALEKMRLLGAALGAQLVQINAKDKKVYHAGLVILCNYMSVLAAQGFKSWSEAGIGEEQARELSAPILRRTLENILAKGPTASLSGPAVRGDTLVVEAETAELSKRNMELGVFYSALADFAKRLAETKRKRS